MILLDGSCGSLLWAMAEEKGIKREPAWKYNIEQPELVSEMHKRYVNAGCDMIQANTFAANGPSVQRSSDYSVREVVSEAVKLAKAAAEGTDTKVYLSSGPLAQLLEPYGKLTKKECYDAYDEIIDAAFVSGADAIMLETFMDIEMMKIAAEAALKSDLPVVCSMTFEKRHRTMMGNTVSQICRALEPVGINAIGMNCSKGPVDGLEIIKEFKETTDLPLYFKPNAGMGETYGPEQFAREMAPSFDYVSYIGGCCGTDESYIKELKREIAASK